MKRGYRTLRCEDHLCYIIFLYNFVLSTSFLLWSSVYLLYMNQYISVYANNVKNGWSHKFKLLVVTSLYSHHFDEAGWNWLKIGAGEAQKFREEGYFRNSSEKYRTHLIELADSKNQGKNRHLKDSTSHSSVIPISFLNGTLLVLRKCVCTPITRFRIRMTNRQECSIYFYVLLFLSLH